MPDVAQTRSVTLRPPTRRGLDLSRIGAIRSVPGPRWGRLVATDVDGVRRRWRGDGSSVGTVRARSGTAVDADTRHLQEFAESRTGVEGFVDRVPPSPRHVDAGRHDGEWTRRRVPSVRVGTRLRATSTESRAMTPRSSAIPDRMRDYNRRIKDGKKATEAQSAPAVSRRSPRLGLLGGQLRRAYARPRRCRPWGCSRTARRR